MKNSTQCKAKIKLETKEELTGRRYPVIFNFLSMALLLLFTLSGHPWFGFGFALIFAIISAISALSIDTKTVKYLVYYIGSKEVEREKI